MQGSVYSTVNDGTGLVEPALRVGLELGIEKV